MRQIRQAYWEIETALNNRPQCEFAHRHGATSEPIAPLEMTIKQIQAEQDKQDCTAQSFTNGPKNVTVRGAVVTTAPLYKIDKNGKLDAIFVQEKGGGAQSGLYVVGPTGVVYAVEFSHRSGRDLINVAKSRTNIIPIIEDARHPQRYRMLVGMVDVVFADVAQPDQARIVALNAQYFLKNEGAFVISIKANCIDSTVPAEAVFAREVKKLQEENFKPSEQLTLEPYAIVRSAIGAATL